MEEFKKKFKKVAKKATKTIKSKAEQKPEPITSKEFEGFKYKVVDGEVKIIGYTGNDSTVKLPEKIEGKTVAAINKGAFKGNSVIEHVELSDTIKIVGSEAFRGCKNLKFVRLPLDLQTINKRTFEGCPSLEEVILPFGLTRIKEKAFKGCASLRRHMHYVKRVAGVTREMNWNLTEEHLPSRLKAIEESAFEGCEKLTEVYLPFAVKKVPANAYKGCTSLEDVYFHNEIDEIGECAFKDCKGLKKVRLPESLKKMGKDAFDDGTILVVDEAFDKSILVNEYEVIAEDAIELDTKMIPGTESQKSFYTESDLIKATEQYELRCPVEHDKTHNVVESPIVPSRYTLEDGWYKNKSNGSQKAKLLMTGDLMCTYHMIRITKNERNSNYDDFFNPVKEILSDSDLTIGNLEIVTSETASYCNETVYVDDGFHLNSPEEFVASVRKAGFDMVTNSQNHIYDAGTRGVFQSLDVVNKYQLIHTGVYAGKNEQRFVLTEINGLKVAILAYLDPARQRAKSVNFTEAGRTAMFNYIDEQTIRKDVEAARAAGAEFVMCYCHWGREFATFTSRRQERMGRMVANCGVDFIWGSHAHVLQPYSVIATDDGRDVPVFYSCGNFISDSSSLLPQCRDSLVLELNLIRDTEGRVVIENTGYHPCLIKNVADRRGDVATFPVKSVLENGTSMDAVELDEDIYRIRSEVGTHKNIKMLGVGDFREKEDAPYAEYELSRPALPKMLSTRELTEDNSYKFDEHDYCYRRNKDRAVKEAKIAVTGLLSYSKYIEQEAESFGKYEFSKSFKGVANIFDSVDFTFGGMDTIAAENFPTMVDMHEVEGYRNARVEYIESVKGAGVDCLAMSNKYNLCAGVEGLFKTEHALKENGIIPSGIGENKDPVVEINGIKVAFISCNTYILNKTDVMTAAGAKKLLNEFNETDFKASIASVKAKGAEFIIAYLNTGNSDKYKLEDRKEAAKQMADWGADYVICASPKVISKYYRYKANDGRIVPIASSLGTLFGDVSTKDASYNTAVLKITLRTKDDGSIECLDQYIPVKVFREFKGTSYAVLPAMKFYNNDYKLSDFKKVKTEIGKKLGDKIELDNSRVTLMSTNFGENYTIQEIYKFLGKKPSAKDLAKFGDKYKKQVSCIVQRRLELREGCVAVMGARDVTLNQERLVYTIKDAVKAGVSLIIADKEYDEIPTIVVDNPDEAFTALTKSIRDKYDPVTVAITGSVGKTTTKDMIKTVFENQFKTLCVKANHNTIYSIRNIVQHLSATDEAYVQEVHEGTPGSASECSLFIRPDIAVITNIGHAHIGQMGSQERLIEEVMRVSDGLKENGVLIINNDSENLRIQNPKVRTVRYSMSDENCDYYARNIELTGEGSTFEIVSKGGEFDEPGVYQAKLNIQAIHNVSNAVAAFAAGRQAGIPPYKIIAALSAFRTEGARQNMVEKGGYKIIVDVYSTTPQSLLSAIETLDSIPVEDGGRRIAVVGFLPDQGKESKQVHYETGKDMCKYNFDEVICTGNHTEYLAQAIKENGRKVSFFKDRELFNSYIAETVRPGDVIMFKSSDRAPAMKDYTIAPLFGKIF